MVAAIVGGGGTSSSGNAIVVDPIPQTSKPYIMYTVWSSYVSSKENWLVEPCDVWERLFVALCIFRFRVLLRTKDPLETVSGKPASIGDAATTSATTSSPPAAAVTAMSAAAAASALPLLLLPLLLLLLRILYTIEQWWGFF